MSLSPYYFKVRDVEGNVFDTTIYKNNIKEALEYILEMGWIIIEESRGMFKPLKSE